MIRNRSSRTSSSAEAAGRAFAAAIALFVAISPAIAAAHHQNRTLIERPYPIEAAPSFPGGLFHWVDSLAGTSGGKTIPAHRAEYQRLFGGMTDDDKDHLRAFVAARNEHLSRGASAMLGVFCSAATVEDALASVRPELSAKHADGLANALAHFRPKYETVWNHGAIPRDFLERARGDPGRARLEALLATIVHFYGVDPLKAPPPRLALVPVPAGYGTHAEAIGNVLLVEIREGDGLADEASVIVHENSHFLWSLVPAERQQRLARAAADMGEAASGTFHLFREAIPTALGQGVADRVFRPKQWATTSHWYHLEDVDTCAKRIFPAVASALDDGVPLDEAFVRRAIEAAWAGP